MREPRGKWGTWKGVEFPDRSLDDSEVVPTVRSPSSARAEFPTPDIAPAARELLTGPVQQDFAALLEFLERQTELDSVRVARLEVTRFFDPEDGSTELVVTEHVLLAQEEVLKYWDHVGEALEGWIVKLPQERLAGVNAIAIHVVSAT